MSCMLMLMFSYLNDFDRYKKLLQLVDIRDNFFFSYSYPVMHRVQQNLSNEQQAEHSSDGKIFIWNEFITRKIRDDVKNTNWTVALVHGFFKQVLGKKSSLLSYCI